MRKEDTGISMSKIQHERSCYIWIQTFVLTTLREGRAERVIMETVWGRPA